MGKRGRPKKRLELEDFEHDVMTPEDVARWLECGVTTVYQMAKQGRLPVMDPEGRLRFYRPALKAWAMGGQMVNLNAIYGTAAAIEIAPFR